MDGEKIFAKLDKMADDIAQLRVDSATSIAILDRNTKDIEAHIRRTDNLEIEVQSLRLIDEKINSQIKTAEAKWKGALWAAGIIFAGISMIGQIVIQQLVQKIVK